MSQTIGFLGLGRMGEPIARNLLAAGFNLRAWNRTSRKVAALPGATPAATPRDAAAEASIIITMLADDQAVEAVTWGPDGILEGMRPGAIHLGMSTISVALARRLLEAHGLAGQRYASAPVFGRPDAAAARALWVVAGGEPAALAVCQPTLEAVGQGTFPLGTAPQANLAKLIGNFLIAATVEAVGEALVLGEKGDIEPARLLNLLVATLFGSPIVRNYGGKIARTEWEPAGFALPLGLKDVVLALSAGAELGAPLPLGELVQARLRTALERGRAHFDWVGLASVIREDAGLPPVRSEG